MLTCKIEPFTPLFYLVVLSSTISYTLIHLN